MFLRSGAFEERSLILYFFKQTLVELSSRILSKDLGNSIQDWAQYQSPDTGFEDIWMACIWFEARNNSRRYDSLTYLTPRRTMSRSTSFRLACLPAPGLGLRSYEHCSMYSTLRQSNPADTIFDPPTSHPCLGTIQYAAWTSREKRGFFSIF